MGKAAQREVARRARVRRQWTWVGGAAALLALVAAIVVWQKEPPSGAPVALTHVHGLGVDPGDQRLYVATHEGLFLLPPTGAPELVGTGRQDTMGFTVAGPSRFLASGHPAPGQAGPQHLGLIESVDAGVTWATRSLPGQADFHALRFRHGTVYGYNSTTGQLLSSSDQVTWQVRATLSLRDFEVSPTGPTTLLATTDAGLQRSTDAGATWQAAGGPPMTLLAWEADDRLFGVTATGDVVRSSDGGATWDPAGRLTGQATALAAHDGTLYAAVHEQGIYISADGGATWTARYRMP